MEWAVSLTSCLFVLLTKFVKDPINQGRGLFVDSSPVTFQLLESEAVTWTQLASDLELSHSEFIEVLRQLPMDNAGVANYLGTTRAMMNKLRWRGLQQLRTQIRKEK